MAYPNDPPVPSGLLPLSSDPINTGLVGWWPLTETDNYVSGAADISSGGNNGTQSGGVLSASTTIGTAASFDGVDDYFNIGNSFWNDSIVGSSDLTVNAWFYVDSTTSDSAVLGRWGAGEEYFIMWVDVGGTAISLTCVGTNSGFAVTSTSTPVVASGAWYMGTLVADSTAGTATVYLNGTSSNSVSFTPSFSTATLNFGIGSDAGNSANRLMDGNIQNVRIWNTALNSDQVASLYSDPWIGSAYTASANTYFFPANFGGRL